MKKGKVHCMRGDGDTSKVQGEHLQQRIKHVFQPFQQPSGVMIDLAGYRAACERLAELQVQPQDVAVETLVVNDLPAEWLIPADPIADRVLLYFHSGTYINGSLATDRVLASRLARTTRTKVLQVAYRLAPEYPFPAAVHDGYAAYQWLFSQGYTSEQIALAGSAAGGGIVLAVLLQAREQGYALPVVAACLSPWSRSRPTSRNTSLWFKEPGRTKPRPGGTGRTQSGVSLMNDVYKPYPAFPDIPAREPGDQTLSSLFQLRGTKWWSRHARCLAKTGKQTSALLWLPERPLLKRIPGGILCVSLSIPAQNENASRIIKQRQPQSAASHAQWPGMRLLA